MNFTDFVKAVADSGASYDEQEGILKIYFELRDSAKKDYNEAVAKLHEVRSYYASKTDDLERETSYLRRQLDDAYGYGQAMRVSCVNSEKRVAELERENEQLKAALAEARAQLPAKVTIDLGEICRLAHNHEGRLINFIKEVRNSDKLIVGSNGERADLRFAKYVCEAVAAVEGTGGSVPCNYTPGTKMTTCSSYNALRREVNFLAMQEYPNHQIEILDI